MALLKSTGNKKVNLDFNKEFINTFSEKIEIGMRICQGWCGERLFFLGSWLVENDFVNVDASPGRNGRCVCGAGW